MPLLIEPQPISLSTDPDGVVRVGSTRVTLDTLVAAFHEGLTAEEIRKQYTSLDLADVYGAIFYYLRHQVEVDAYLEERRKLGREVRAESDRRFAGQGLRQRLVGRRNP
ncbi:MAG: DUF433 domain-containing protein [Acidobacteriota bacterium]